MFVLSLIIFSTRQKYLLTNFSFLLCSFVIAVYPVHSRLVGKQYVKSLICESDFPVLLFLLHGLKDFRKAL